MPWYVYFLFQCGLWLLVRPIGPNMTDFGGLERRSEQSRWRTACIVLILLSAELTVFYFINGDEENNVRLATSLATSVLTCCIVVWRWRPRKNGRAEGGKDKMR